MKKKLLTTVLTVGMVLSLVGCGAKETTSSESVAETTEVTTEYGTEETIVEEVVGETTVAETEAVEEVVEEPVKEKIPVDITDGAAFMNQVFENYEAQKYIVSERDYISRNVDDSSIKDEWNGEYLYDWNKNIACAIYYDGSLRYQDYANSVSYVNNEDSTGFLSFSTSEESFVKDEFESVYAMLKQYIELFENDGFIVTELAEGNYAGYYCATNQSIDETNSLIYTVNVYVDPYTLLPINITTTCCDSSHEIVLEDGTTVSGEYFVVAEDSYNFQFLTEEDTDFATFQTAIQLPATDECDSVSFEGETTTTE